MMNDEFWDSHIIRVRNNRKHGQQINLGNVVPLSLMSLCPFVPYAASLVNG